MAADRIRDAVDAKMTALTARYAEVENEINSAAMSGNNARVVALGREHAKLRVIVEPYHKRHKLTSEIAELSSMLADSNGDAEIKAMAEAELPALERQAQSIDQELLDYFLAGDDANIDSVIVEIRAGTGGDEAALFARDLYEMYTRYAERTGFKVEAMDVSPTELGGFREVILNVRGPGVYRKLQYEGGGHRVQRVPETEQQGRVHTSAATVAVLPEAEELDVKIDWAEDVLEHVSCAGGPGGQNVNKVATAIKLEHKATGITVSMRDERSQHKNRDKARRIMLSRLAEHYQRAAHASQAAARKNMIGSGDRNERIRTYNFPQNRCTDHRINENFPLDRVVSGDLTEMIDLLQRNDRDRRIAAL